MKKTYVLLDAMGIQSYIFETNTLKIILGASLALSRWQEECKAIAVKCSGEAMASAGGNVLAVFNKEDDAHSFIAEGIDKRPKGMAIARAMADDTGNDLETWRSLQRNIIRYKSGDRDSSDYPIDEEPVLPGCLHCGCRPSDGKKKIDDRSTCGICRHLHSLSAELETPLKSTKSTAIEKLYTIPENPFPSQLEEMVKRPDGKGNDLMAVVVIDLNDMGNRIKNIIAENGFNAFKDFSVKLENDFYESFCSTVKIFAPQNGGIPNDMSFIRLRPLVLGGDDAIFTMPAPMWPLFVSTTLASLKKKGYPACAGITIAKHNFPINRLVLMAEDLVKSAKGLSRFRNKKELALDWHIHQESAFSDPMAVRKRNYFISSDRYTDFHAVCTRRPYTLDEFVELKKNANSISTATSSISNRKIYTLYQSLRQGPKKTQEILKYIFLRDENDHMEKYKRIWEEVWKNPINPELIEIEYPLWDLVTDQNGVVRDLDNKRLYDTQWTDIIELKWLMEGPVSNEEDE